MSLFNRQRPDELPGKSSSHLSPEQEGVEGERGDSAVQRPPSLQSRATNWLAAGLMGTLGVGFLGWYYVHSIVGRKQARNAAQHSASDKAKGDVALRPLGRVDPPVITLQEERPTIESVLGNAPPEPPAPKDSRPWMQPVNQSAVGASTTPPPKTPAELLLERQLAGPAFATLSKAPVAAPGEAGGAENRAAGGGDLDTLLKGSITTPVRAQVLPTQRLLLPKGAFIDCTLETAIDSTLPGMTTCIMATDSFSADGSVVLLERGTKLVGETRGQVHAGSARVFVLWTEARTPTGVVVPLASPGTDELGRSGLPGDVNRHFLERFGAAILISVIDGVVQGAANRNSGGSTVVVSPTNSSEVVTEVLKDTVNIPPTVTKPQGDRIQVLVARDLDFRSVYELRPVTSGR
jgi:type IV secretion system protein VirB10